jgi:gliding motility-associated-like protein
MKRLLPGLLLLCLPFRLIAQTPANNDCSNAQVISIPASGSACITSTNANATSDGNINTCDTGPAGSEVWFTYVATGSVNTVTVTPQGSTTNMVVSMLSAGCSGGVLDGCNAAAGSGSATASVGYTPGTQVWISVETNGVDGPFQLCVTSSTPPANPGEACASATQMCAKTDFGYSTLTGFTSSGLRPTCFGAAVQQDVWVKFTVGVTGTLEFTADPLGSAEFDWALYDITSGCPVNATAPVSCNYNTATNLLGCNMGGAACGMSSNAAAFPCPAEFNAPVTVTAGRTYAIVIDNYSANGAGFNFSWGGTFEMAPKSSFTLSPTSGCGTPLTTTITNTSAAATSYAWNFGDNTSSTSANPGSHTYTTPGNYIISLVTTANGCTDVSYQQVTLSIPTVSVTPSSTKVCPGGSATLTANASPFPPSYGLSFSNQTDMAVANNATINSSLTASGLNTLIATGTIASVCFDISHTNDADLDVSLVSPGGTVIDLTSDNGGTGNDYTNTCFVTGGTAIAGLGAAATPFNGNYAPEQAFTLLNGGAANGNWQLRVTDDGGTGGGGTLLGWTISFNVNNSIVSYAWSPGGVTTSANTVSPASTTTYSVVATDFKGCTNSAQAVVRVKAPAAPVAAGATICSGTTATLTATPANTSGPLATGAAATYAWYSASTGGTLLGSLASYTTPVLTATTTYYVETADSGCTSLSRTPVVVTVVPLPGITASPATICSGATTSVGLSSSTAGTSFSWTASAPAGVAGSAAGSGSTISQTLTNSTALPATVTYTITPTGPAPTSCVGSPSTVTVTVNPVPSVTASPATICSGATTNVALSSAVTGTTFTWTASAPASVTGSSGGSGNAISQTLINSGTTAATVTYTVTPTGPAPTNCAGTPASVTVTVLPAPTVTATPATICSGATSSVGLSSGVAGTTFTWAASAPASVTGSSGGSGNAISQTLVNTGSVAATVTYTVTPTGPAPSSCPGTPSTVTVTVAPTPVATATPSSQEICSGNTTSIGFTATVSGSSFSWTASAPAGVTGAASGSGTTLAQTLSNTGTAPATVTYTVTPAGPAPSSCPGAPVTVTVVVNPAPVVTAAPASICSGTSPNISLSSTTAGTTFSWTANAPASVTGASAGTGASINQTLTNTGTAAATATYTVTPTGPAPSSCPGTPVNVVVTVNPTPVATAAPVTICSGTSAGIALTGNVSGTTFTWTANAPASVTGSSGGSGTSIAQVLTNTGTVPATVTYTVTPTGPAPSSCPGAAITVTATVNPAPVATASPVEICSGATATVPLSSTVAGTTFSWTASAPASVTGSASGSSSAISQLLTSTATVPAAVTYTVTPAGPAPGNCPGAPVTVVVTVNPTPVATATPSPVTICSGTAPSIALTGTVSGTTFSWTANAPGTVTGASSGTGSTIAQVLNNSGMAQASVTYTISPVGPAPSSCPGLPVTAEVKVEPVPAGPGVVSPVTYCQNTPATQLTATGTGLLWYTQPTGGTGSATAPTPSTSSTGSTTYYVSQTVNGCESQRVPVQVIVNAIPAAPVSATPLTYCQGDPVAPLTAAGSAGGTIQWYSDAALSSQVATGSPFSPSVTSGISFWVVDVQAGCKSLPVKVDIVINPSDDPSFSYSSGTYCITGTDPVPTVTGLSGGTFSASPSGLDIDPATGKITLLTSALKTYTVTYTTNGPCPDSATATVTISASPNAVFTLIGPYCAGGSVNPVPDFGGIGSAGFFTSLPPTPALDPNTGEIDLLAILPGSYTIVNTIAPGGGCAPSVHSQVIVIEETPVVTATPTSETICSGSATTISITQNVPGLPSWTVSSINGPVTGSSSGTGYTIAQTLINSGTAPGTVTYQISPVISATCPGTPIDVVVTVNPSPAAPSVTSPVVYCQNVPAFPLTATPSGTNTLNWYTSSAGGAPLSGAPIPVTSVAGTTTYYVSQTENGCEGPRAAIVVTVNPTPPAPVVPAPATYCEGDPVLDLTASGTGGTLRWYDDATLSNQVGTGSPFTSNATTTRSFWVVEIKNGCAGPSSKVDIVINPLDDAAFSYSSGTFCSSGSNASPVIAGASGGTFSSTPAGLVIDPATGVIDVASSTVGNLYTVTYTTNGMCPASSSVNITITNGFDASFTLGGPYCQSDVNPFPVFTGSAGTFSATPAGLVFVNTNTGEINLAASSAGTYTITNTIPASGGCAAATATQTVVILASPAAPAVTSPVIYCENQASSSLTATGTGLLWYTSPTGGTGSSTAPTPNTGTSGTSVHYVSQTINGCEGPRVAVTVIVNPSPAAPVAASPAPYCQGMPVADLTASGSGGTLNWYNSSTLSQLVGTGSPFASGATATTSFWVTERAGGCEGPATQVNLIINPLDDPSFSYSSGTYCITGANPTPVITGRPGGTFTSSPSGLVINSSTGQINLSASFINTYKVTYETNGPCPQSFSTTVTIVSMAVADFTYAGPYCLTAPNPSPAYLNGGSAGVFSSSPGGLALNPATGVINLSLSTPGTYTVTNTITGGGCLPVSFTATVVINATPAAPGVMPLAYCRGVVAPQLTASGTNLLWYNSLTGGTGNPSAPVPSTSTAPLITNYYVSQTVGGCESARSTLTVTVNILPAAPAASPVQYCGNATAAPLTASGTNLLWYTASSGGTGVASVTPSTATPGTVNYWVTQSQNGCESPRTKVPVTVNSTPAPAVTSPVNICMNSAATPLTASGTDLLWYAAPSGGTGSPAAPTPSTAVTGTTTYYVSQTLNSCEGPRVAITVNVNAPGAPAVTSPVTYCINATASPLSASGTNLLWYTAPAGGTGTALAPVPSTAVAGTVSYYVSQTSNAGCEGPRAQVDVQVNQTPDPVPTSPTYCQNAPAVPLAATGTPTGVLSWYIAPSGGVALTGAALTPSTSASGVTTYYVDQFDQGCTSQRVPAVVTVEPQPADPQVNVVPVCEGNPSVLTAVSPGGTYRWFDAANNPVFTGPSYTTPVLTANTTYLVEVENMQTCVSNRIPVVALVNALPVAPSVAGVAVCEGASASLAVSSGAGTFDWYTTPAGGTPVFTGTAYTTGPLSSTTVYYVEAVSAQACTSLARTPVTVTVNPLPAAPVMTDVTVCEGSTATLNVSSPAGTFDWFSTAAAGTAFHSGSSYTTAVLSNSVTYYVEATSAFGCVSASRSPVTVTVNPLPSQPLVPVNPSVCAGVPYPTLSATPTSGGSLSWYSDAALTNQLTTGTSYTAPGNVAASITFYVRETALGCSGPAAPVTITVIPAPAPLIAPYTQSGCSPLPSSFSVSNPEPSCIYKWSFSPGDTLQGPNASGVFSYNGTGGSSVKQITLVAVNTTGCKTLINLNVTVHETPVASFFTDSDVLSTLNPVTGFTDASRGVTIDTWSWSFGDGESSSARNPEHTYALPGIYPVTLVVLNSATGCSDTATRQMRVREDFALYIPDAFTPNEDGRNDVFRAEGVGLLSFDMRIFNRWGNEIYHTSDIREGWNGNAFNGSEVSLQDVYVYRIVAVDIQGKKHEYVGKVTLVR